MNRSAPTPRPSRPIPPARAGPGAASPAELLYPVLGTLHVFRAELDLSELDERLRPGPTWTAVSAALSRAGMVLLSRRMSYVNRRLLIAVHLIDSEPTPLLGKVIECEYHGEGLHRVVVEFEPVPPLERVTAWFAEVSRGKGG